MSVLIFAPPDDVHAFAVFSLLSKRGVDVAWVDMLALPTDMAISVEIGTTREVLLTGRQIGRLDLSSFDTIWWRQPRAPLLDQVDGEQTRFVEGEWDSLFRSLESVVDTRWVNSPAAFHNSRRKAIQLKIASAEQLRIPETLITNDPEAVRRMYARGHPLVYKALGGTGRPLVATRMVTVPDLARLDALVTCPAIFQEHISARSDIRVTVIGDSLYAVSIDSQAGSSPLDWRFDNTVKYSKHSLDPGVANSLRRLMHRLNLDIGAIDLRLTPDGEYVFLEVNPGGQYMFVELLASVSLTARMATFLAGQRLRRALT